MQISATYLQVLLPGTVSLLCRYTSGNLKGIRTLGAQKQAWEHDPKRSEGVACSREEPHVILEQKALISKHCPNSELNDISGCSYTAVTQGNLGSKKSFFQSPPTKKARRKASTLHPMLSVDSPTT